MKTPRILLLAAAAMAMAAPSTRADFIQGVTIESVSSEVGASFDRFAVHTVDGSGLAGSGHSSFPNGTMWDANTYDGVSDPAPSITFDLGADYLVDRFNVWNYNAADFNGFAYRERGVKGLTILASTNGTSFLSVGDFTFAIGTGLDGYLGESIDLSGFSTRYIRFDIKSNYSAEGLAFGAGLSEVRFTGIRAVPEPASLAMLGLGGAGLALVRRRSRRDQVMA